MSAVSPGPGGAAPTEVWIVVLEFARASGRPFLVSDVQALIAHLAERRPAALCHPDRYAVQLQVRARNAHQALGRASAYHHEAARAAGLWAATLVRVEVTTVEEYERSLDVELYDAAATPASADAPLGLLCDELYCASRRVQAAKSHRDVVDTIIGFVITIGGRVEPGAPRHLPGTIDLDVTLESGRARHAVAGSHSVAGVIIEQSLPALLADAHRAIDRLRQEQPERKRAQPPTCLEGDPRDGPSGPLPYESR